MPNSLGLLLIGLFAGIRADLPPVPPLAPNPLSGVVETLRSFATGVTLATHSGLNASSYLNTLSGVVDWFLPHQNSVGAIIDPATGQEEEYSTPCFAHASAKLVVSGGRSDLLAPAALALNWTLHSLAIRDCATGHCDFFSVPAMRTYALLAPLLPAQAPAWEALIRSIGTGTWELTGNNWELTAAAGEYERIVNRGWGGQMNWTFWEGRIGRLITVLGERGGFWEPSGIFRDNLCCSVLSPMAYDAFGSSYNALLLTAGYNHTGVYKTYLTEMMARGVLTRAAYQSPLGEQPVGGRSNQHQFAEAVLCAVAEIYAARAAAAGDAAGACQLKRAARLYHASIRRWIRGDGAIQITKNRFLNYSERFGYMGYSFFSNYNLLPMSWLAIAHEFAEEGIPECAAPADVGGAAFALDSPAMRKVFASSGGVYLELITGADPEFDASGLNRLHYDACALPAAPTPCRLDSLLGPSQAPGITGNSGLQAGGGGGGSSGASGGLSTGAFWSLVGDAPGVRRTIGNNTLGSVLAAIVTAAPENSPTNGVQFSVQYVLWEQGVLLTEAYALAPMTNSGTGVLVNATASLSRPGAPALFELMARARAVADGSHVFFSPPADDALAAALTVDSRGAFFALAPQHPRGYPLPAFARMGISFPGFAYDGTTNFTVTAPGAWGKDSILVQSPTQPPESQSGSLVFSVLSTKQLTWEADFEHLLPSRNGLLAPIYADLATATDSPTMAYSLSIVPWQTLAAPPPRS